MMCIGKREELMEKISFQKAVYEGPVVQFYGVDGNFSIPKYWTFNYFFAPPVVFRRLHHLLQVVVVLMGCVLWVKFNNVVPRLEC